MKVRLTGFSLRPRECYYTERPRPGFEGHLLDAASHRSRLKGEATSPFDQVTAGGLIAQFLTDGHRTVPSFVSPRNCFPICRRDSPRPRSAFFQLYSEAHGMTRRSCYRWHDSSGIFFDHDSNDPLEATLKIFPLFELTGIFVKSPRPWRNP